MLFVIFMFRQPRGRYRRLGPADALVMALAVVGVGLATWGADDPSAALSGGLWRSLAGSALALLSAVTVALGAKAYKWGANTVGEIMAPIGKGQSLEWGLVVAVYATANLLVVPVCMALAAASGGVFLRAFTAGWLFGVIAGLPAAAMTQKANLDTGDLMVNTIRYTQTFVSLGVVVGVDRSDSRERPDGASRSSGNSDLQHAFQPEGKWANPPLKASNIYMSERGAEK